MVGKSLKSKRGLWSSFGVSLLCQMTGASLICRAAPAIVVARAFTTSQSAAAHRILFHRIFAIVEADTGCPVQFRHIHGSGFDTFVADGHKGQALGICIFPYTSCLENKHILGLGQYCQDICVNRAGYCSIEWNRALHSLSAYEHLARFYRYCFAHFTRNIAGLRGHVSPKVQQAMMSIASAEPLPDFKGTLDLIQKGGKKAAGKSFTLARPRNIKLTVTNY